MTINKKLIVSGIVALSLVTVGAVAFAQSTTNPMNLAINNSGQVALSGTVSAVSGNTISVNSWLGTWTVNNVNLANISVGDTVKVAGSLGTGMAVNATAVKDASVAKHVFNGTIGNLNATAGTFTLATENAGTVNVATNANTQISLNGSVAVLTGLANGNTATVSGVFNANTNTVTAASIKVPAIQKEKDNDNDGQHNHNGWLNINWNGWFKSWFKKS